MPMPTLFLLLEERKRVRRAMAQAVLARAVAEM
jgi:hypothetical protein